MSNNYLNLANEVYDRPTMIDVSNDYAALDLNHDHDYDPVTNVNENHVDHATHYLD